MKQVLFMFVLFVLSSALYAQVEELDETLEIEMPLVYLHPEGYALSMVMFSADEGYFAVVAISEGTNCELNSIEGEIKPKKSKPGCYIAEKEGCEFAEIQITDNKLVLTEKKCKNVNRESCFSLSGTYTLDTGE